MPTWKDDLFWTVLSELATWPYVRDQFRLTYLRPSGMLKTVRVHEIRNYRRGGRGYFELFRQKNSAESIRISFGQVLRIEVQDGGKPQIFEHPDYEKLATVAALLSIGGTAEPTPWQCRSSCRNPHDPPRKRHRRT